MGEISETLILTQIVLLLIKMVKAEKNVESYEITLSTKYCKINYSTCINKKISLRIRCRFMNMDEERAKSTLLRISVGNRVVCVITHLSGLCIIILNNC